LAAVKCAGIGWVCALAALILAGCASLPDIDSTDVPARGGVVTLYGAQSALTPEQTVKAVARLSNDEATAEAVQRHLVREGALSGSRLTAGNAVTLLQDGPATYRAMLDAIESARDHVNMETYILDDDEVGQQFAKALIAKQKSGVQVNLIRDAVGTLTTPPEFFAALAASGIAVLEFNPVNPFLARKGWELNQRDHRKLLIVDGRVVFLGGINISSVYSSSSFKLRSRSPKTGSSKPSGPAWRDTDLRISGPVVAEFQKLFINTWQAQMGPALVQKNYFPALQREGPQVVRAVGSAPDEPARWVYTELLSAIANAQESVRITNAYFAPDRQLLNVLEATARRGVAVDLILPSQTDSWLIFHAGRGYYERLLSAGVKIHERLDVILHAKTALIDGVWATVGSTNLDWRSFLHNQEVNAVVIGADFGGQLQKMFDADLAASKAITLPDWQQRPFTVRAKELFARMWAYWL
jgi:cardiolipin synthase A/B